MADKIIQFQDDSGDLVPVKAVDNGDGTYSLSVDAELEVGSLTIGKVDQGNAGVQAWLITGPLTNTELRASNIGVTPHGLTVQADSTPTLTVHSGYATGDYIGTSGTPITFSGCASANGGTGVVVGALIIDGATQSVSGELWLFDNTVTPPNDSAAWTISDADAKKCVGIVPFNGSTNPYYASAQNSICPVGGLSIVFKTQPNSQNLYGCFITRGSPTYADGDLTFRLRIWQD